MQGQKMKIIQEQDTEQGSREQYLTLQNLALTEKHQELKLRDEHQFYTCPYRFTNKFLKREALRNQFGKKFREKNGNRLPSLNQIKNGVILTNLILIE